MEHDEFDALYKQACIDCKQNLVQAEKEEEQKLQEQFMASLDLKAEEKASKGH